MERLEKWSDAQQICTILWKEGRSPSKGVNPSLGMQINGTTLLTDHTELMAAGVWYCINSFNTINIQLVVTNTLWTKNYSGLGFGLGSERIKEILYSPE